MDRNISDATPFFFARVSGSKDFFLFGVGVGFFGDIALKKLQTSPGFTSKPACFMVSSFHANRDDLV
jgi:hypothetical protein